MEITVMVEHCLTAISGVAASAGTYITKYYSSLIPSLKVEESDTDPSGLSFCLFRSFFFSFYIFAATCLFPFRFSLASVFTCQGFGHASDEGGTQTDSRTWHRMLHYHWHTEREGDIHARYGNMHFFFFFFRFHCLFRALVFMFFIRLCCHVYLFADALDVFDLMSILGSLEQYALNLDDPMHNYIMRCKLRVERCFFVSSLVSFLLDSFLFVRLHFFFWFGSSSSSCSCLLSAVSDP
jgi:hypothetical protein